MRYCAVATKPDLLFQHHQPRLALRDLQAKAASQHFQSSPQQGYIPLLHKHALLAVRVLQGPGVHVGGSRLVAELAVPAFRGGGRFEDQFAPAGKDAEVIALQFQAVADGEEGVVDAVAVRSGGNGIFFPLHRPMVASLVIFAGRLAA